MSKLLQLTEDEYKIICSVISHKYIVGYFQKNPKDFSRLYPGFRATALQNKDAVKILVKFRERGFISSFVEKVVNDWLNEIKSAIQVYQESGESELVSSIHALSQSFFSNNVSAYYKLVENDYNVDNLDLISSMVLLLKNAEEKRSELEYTANKLKNELNDCKQTASRNEKQLQRSNSQLADLTSKLNELKSFEKKYQDLLENINQVQKQKNDATLQISDLKKHVLYLTDTIKKIEKEKADLEVSIRTKIIEEEKVESLYAKSSVPLIPKNTEEFKEYLSYNLESIGLSDSTLPIKTLLTAYISNVIFQGKPIICNKCYADVLAKCISNTLIGDKNIITICFSSDITEKQICNAINNSNRIIVLDNFLGNFNETVLLSILDRFKCKMIFLTVSYEKTLYYLPTDFLAFGHYINLDRIPNFAKTSGPDEDPSYFEEEELPEIVYPIKNRYQEIVQKIALDLGYSTLLSEKITEFIYDDISACATLIFNLLPYTSAVLDKNAFNASESLYRYACRCPYKKIFEEWYMA